GKRNINAEFAVLFETVLPDLKAQDWLNHQAEYDIYITREADGVKRQGKLIDTWNSINEHVNVAFLKKKLRLSDNLEEAIDSIYTSLKISDVKELDVRRNNVLGYFRKSESSSTDPRNLLTWLCLVRTQSQNAELSIRKFDKRCINTLVQELNGIFFENDNTIERTRKILNDYGIKFFTIEKLEKMPVDGLSFWSGSHPTIVLTARFNRIDNFAFTLFHELGHLYLHLNKDDENEFLDDIKTANKHVSGKEKEANEFASKSIWGNHDYLELFNRISIPFAAGPYLQKVSSILHINMGIMAGQYQHYCDQYHKSKSPYAICRKFIEPIK
ncbi:MAG: ImmA/IrrE family metallo-endopeptidase, partial [Prevotellaceae bacterium]|nr:ImmA/IrrE family metallo-endopeptidase [Prevotellaceae bacterium]